MIVAIAYVAGVIVAAILIAIINFDESVHDAVSFVPYTEAWYSWAFVIFCLYVFVDTWRNMR